MIVQKRNKIIDQIIVNKSYQVYNGKTFVTLNITEEIVGKSFGSFIFTRKRGQDSKKK